MGYVGTSHGLEAKLLPEVPDVEFFKIEALGLERYLSVRTSLALLMNAKGLFQALKVVRSFRPRLIIGFGGYASFSTVLCGLLLHIPTVIHEQNVVPGLTNKLLAPWVDCVLLTYPETAGFLRAKRWVVTGVPLRHSILEVRSLTVKEAKVRSGLDPERPMVLILGGSHGACALYDPILKGYERLRSEGIQLVILAGREAERLWTLPLCKDVLVLGHTSQIGLFIRAADLVISRAGGATLAELTALGVPAIVIPWPGATAGHQEKNALWLARRGACRLILQDQLQKVQIVEEILRLLQDGEGLRELADRSARCGRIEATSHMIREVEPYLHEPEVLSFHRHRWGWDERLGLGPTRVWSSNQRLGH